MRTLLSCVAALALVGAAFADTPASVSAPSHGKYVSYNSVGGLDPADGDIILDGLCMLQAPWEIGNGDTCGGSAVFGFDYDLQTADDFTTSQPFTLTGVAADFLQIFGTQADTVCISVFDGTCGGADNSAACYVETPVDAAIPQTDPYGYYPVWRYVVKHDLCDLPEGQYYITMNPKMTDWGYVVGRYTDPGCGDFTCEGLLRDGGDNNPCCNGNGGFGSTTWISSGGAGYSYQVQVRFGPAVPRCIYTVAKAKLLANVCGKVCDTCPYGRGDLVCTNQCPDGDTQCASRLKGVNACANGAACKVIANFTACAEAPRNCKRCK